MVTNICISLSEKDFHLYSVIWNSNKKWKSLEGMAPIIDSSLPDNQKAVHTLTPRKNLLNLNVYEALCFHHWYLFFKSFLNLCFWFFFWLQWIFTAAHRLFAACGEQVLLSRGGAWASHCSGFWLWSTDSRTRRLQQLRHMGSVIEACKL